MLLGVRRAAANEIIRAGHGMRIYVPFGSDWYGYSVAPPEGESTGRRAQGNVYRQIKSRIIELSPVRFYILSCMKNIFLIILIVTEVCRLCRDAQKSGLFAAESVYRDVQHRLARRWRKRRQNLRTEEDFKRIAGVIAEANPDVMGLREIKNRAQKHYWLICPIIHFISVSMVGRRTCVSFTAKTCR